MDNNYIVYAHVFPNGKKYIGITNRPYLERWGKNGTGYKKQKVFDAICYYGWKNIKHYILYKNLTWEEALLKEEELIQKYHTTDKQYGYNVSEGKDSREVICINTKKIYDNAKLAAKDYIGITTDKDIRRCCRGTISYAGIDPINNNKLIWMKYIEYRKSIVSKLKERS